MMINKTLTILSVALLALTACKPEQEATNTKTASVPTQSISQNENRTVATAPAQNNAANTNKQPEPCNNLRPVSDMEDLMRQIVSNLDSSCLFTYSPHELEQIWATSPTPNIYSIMFPELNPNDPDYFNKVQNEMDKVMNGSRQLDETTAARVALTVKQTGNPSAINIGGGTWSSSGTSKQARQGRFFSINPNEIYKTKHGGFGKGFNNINELPDFFREHSENRQNENRFYRYNSSSNPDLPLIDIYYDGATGRIQSIEIYDKKRN